MLSLRGRIGLGGALFLLLSTACSVSGQEGEGKYRRCRTGPGLQPRVCPCRPVTNICPLPAGSELQRRQASWDYSSLLAPSRFAGVRFDGASPAVLLPPRGVAAAADASVHPVPPLRNHCWSAGCTF